MRKAKAFTVAELITVIAIIGILAAIAIPNFLEAAKPSPVSKVKAAQRSLGTALESYYVEYKCYPAFSVNPKENAFCKIKKAKKLNLIKNISTFKMPNNKGLHTLTTPIEFIESYSYDRFSPAGKATYGYYSDGAGWILWSAGPDGDYDMDYDVVKGYYSSKISQPSLDLLTKFTYDPSNGTTSNGDVYRVYQ